MVESEKMQKLNEEEREKILDSLNWSEIGYNKKLYIAVYDASTQ